jgi:hypothetical protein
MRFTNYRISVLPIHRLLIQRNHSVPQLNIQQAHALRRATRLPNRSPATEDFAGSHESTQMVLPYWLVRLAPKPSACRARILFSPQQVPRLLIDRMLGKRVVRRQAYSVPYFANDLNGNDVPGVYRNDVHSEEVNILSGVWFLPAPVKRADVIFLRPDTR